MTTNEGAGITDIENELSIHLMGYVHAWIDWFLFGSKTADEPYSRWLITHVQWKILINNMLISYNFQKITNKTVKTFNTASNYSFLISDFKVKRLPFLHGIFIL